MTKREPISRLRMFIGISALLMCIFIVGACSLWIPSGGKWKYLQANETFLPAVRSPAAQLKTLGI
jgi:hypothetical protein